MNSEKGKGILSGARGICRRSRKACHHRRRCSSFSVAASWKQQAPFAFAGCCILTPQDKPRTGSWRCSIIFSNMENTNVDEKILSYNDVVLRRSDLDILSGPYFLNDRIIEFYFSYLTSCYPFEDILLVPPSITFWIKECPDIASLKDFVEPLYFSRKQLIIFPINDNVDVTITEGGSHWSLLAFERNENIFVHHDSSGGINNMHANRVFRAVIYCMSSDARYVDCSRTPRQANGYDCGLYVTAIAREICRWYGSDERPKHKKDLWFSTVKEQITPFLVSKMRNEILELLQSLMVK